MSGEARDKALRDGRIVQSSEALENDRQLGRKPSKAGGFVEIFNFGSPKARWRQQIHKYGPLNILSSGDATYTVSGAIPGRPGIPLKVEQITLFITSSLSSSVFIDKVGFVGSNATAYPSTIGNSFDADYFYTGSMDDTTGFHYVSSSGDALISGQARRGSNAYTAADLYNGGYFTGSADITIELSDAPNGEGSEGGNGATGSMYLYVYADRIWKAFE